MGAETALFGIAATRSLSDLVADHLVQQLVSGGLAQGQRVNEAEMARALGISRNPIREALSGLHERGMLIAVPRRGSFVRQFTVHDVNEIFSYRMSLERFTFQTAVGAIRPGDIERLDAIYAKMIRLAALDDVHAVRKLDMAVHCEVARIARNRHAINAVESLTTEILMLMSIPHAQVESLPASAADHLPLIEALRARSVLAALKAIETHVQRQWNLMLHLYEQVAAMAAA